MFILIIFRSSCQFTVGVFARPMHSTSEFAMTVLSKCVIHAGFVKVAWTLRGNAFLSRMWMQRPDVWIYIFNLVIRLGKVKQLAFFSGFHQSIVVWLNSLPLWLASPFLRLLLFCIAGSCDNNSFFNIARAFSDVDTCNMRIPGTGHACRYGDSSFCGRWWGSIVHVIQGLTT